MQSQLNLSVWAFSKRLILKLKLCKSHVRKHLLVLISLASDSKLASFYEWRGLLNLLDLVRVKRCDNTAT